MLPRIKIYFENGALKQSAQSPDGLMGLLCTGVAVAATFALSTPYILRGLDSLTPLGITEVNNPSVYKIVREFYAEAGDGTEVWLMAFPDTVKHSEMIDVANGNYGKKLVDAANGKLRGVVVSRKPAAGYVATITDGLDADIAAALPKAQEFAEYYTNSKFAPLFVILEGFGFNGNAIDLLDLTTKTYNRVSVFIGDTLSGSGKATLGTIAGRIAKSPIHQNIGRTKYGPVAPVVTYIGSTVTELADVATINDKGYITFRTFTGRSGYFFNDDFTATSASDDYGHLTARRTIDKAYRIAYDTLVDELLDAVSVNADGTLQLPVVKGWQANVEGAIARQMTANGELSADVASGDRGVECYIDPAQNLVSTSKLNVRIRVRPFGYPRYIDVYLGFQVIAA